MLVAKTQQLLIRYNKRTHITPIQKDNILIFGEETPIAELQLKNNLKKKDLYTILKEILREYATPIFDLYSQKL